MFVPNGFSPDGDGVNDQFVIEGIFNYPNNSLTIFNRWGNVIYKKDNYDNTFDGIPNVKGLIFGKGRVPSGTYYFIFDLGVGDHTRAGYLIIKY